MIEVMRTRILSLILVASAGAAALGCVMVRFIGCAVFGAVVVEGGAALVREPRDPELLPPPTRASA